MNTNIVDQLLLILPELVIVIGAIFLIIISLYCQMYSYKRVLEISIIFVLISLTLLLFFPNYGDVFNEALIIDNFSRFMKILTLLSTTIVMIISISFAKLEKLEKFEFPIMILFATFGMMLLISSGNMLSLYISIEIQSLSLYVLASIDRDNLKSSEAGIKFFILGALSSAILLYGISLLYGYTGTINFIDIKEVFSLQNKNFGSTLGLVFVLSGIIFKISAVPFHMWAPDVYEGSPTPITAFFATAAKISAISILIRIIITSFDSHIFIEHTISSWRGIIICVSFLSMVLGSIAGISQINIKRLMAYSSIAHIGYALAGFSSGTIIGIQSIMIYLVIYTITVLGTFACIVSMNRDEGYLENIYDLSGLAYSNPFIGIAMTIHLFSLCGIPPLAGFFGKWYAFSSAMENHLLILVIIGILASVVSSFYYLRIVKLIWVDEPKSNFLAIPKELYCVLLFSTVFIVFYIIFGSFIISWVESSAKSLF